jgi:hypothetical protein
MALLSSTCRGSPIWAIAMSILPAFAIAYLALISASRVYRAALFPIALYGLWVVTETYITSIRELTEKLDKTVADDQRTRRPSTKHASPA